MTEKGKVENSEIKDDLAEEQSDLQNEEYPLNNQDETANGNMQEEGGNDTLELRQKIVELEKQKEEYLDIAKRTKAEFDNYRKRSIKEKESMYDDGISDSVKNLLPILDNLERAVAFSEAKSGSFFEGVNMVLKIFRDTLNKMGVEEIKTEGQKFDPNFHNAVMHIEDEALEENIIVEVFQKGYIYKNKVIRHSMVKVAN